MGGGSGFCSETLRRRVGLRREWVHEAFRYLRSKKKRCDFPYFFFLFFVFWVKLNFLLDSDCGFVWFGWKWLWEGSVGVQGFGLCFLMSFRWWVQFGVLCFCLVLMEMVLGSLILIFVEIMFFIIIIIIWNGGGDFIWFGFKWL